MPSKIISWSFIALLTLAACKTAQQADDSSVKAVAEFSNPQNGENLADAIHKSLSIITQYAYGTDGEELGVTDTNFSSATLSKYDATNDLQTRFNAAWERLGTPWRDSVDKYEYKWIDALGNNHSIDLYIEVIRSPRPIGSTPFVNLQITRASFFMGTQKQDDFTADYAGITLTRAEWNKGGKLSAFDTPKLQESHIRRQYAGGALPHVKIGHCGNDSSSAPEMTYKNIGSPELSGIFKEKVYGVWDVHFRYDLAKYNQAHASLQSSGVAFTNANKAKMMWNNRIPNTECFIRVNK